MRKEKKSFTMIIALILYPFMFLIPIESLTFDFKGGIWHFVCLAYLIILGFVIPGIGIWINLVMILIAAIVSIVHQSYIETIIIVAIPLLYACLTLVPAFFHKKD